MLYANSLLKFGGRSLLISFTLAMAMPCSRAESVTAETFKATLPLVCADLQAQGWSVPSDLKKINPGAKAELKLGNMLYSCHIAKTLLAGDIGHAPDIAVMLSYSGGESSAIISGDYWCAADRVATVSELAEQVKSFAKAARLTLPDKLFTAIGTMKNGRWSTEGVDYSVTPIEVDAQACSKVPPDKLGAVMAKIDVEITLSKLATR